MTAKLKFKEDIMQNPLVSQCCIVQKVFNRTKYKIFN